MAISPASDIVLDVIRAADPANVREAQRALAEKAGEASAASFAAAESEVAGLHASAAPRGGMAASHDAMKTYRDFEAMVLQTFVKSMLPQDAQQYFGEGTAGEIWKGMMAEHLGRMIVEGGGIGIAEQIVPDDARMTAEGRLVTTHTSDDARDRATSLLNELQRATMADWVDDAVPSGITGTSSF